MMFFFIKMTKAKKVIEAYDVNTKINKNVALCN